MATGSTFSYAQAAKGQGGPAPQSSTPSSTQPTETATPTPVWDSQGRQEPSDAPAQTSTSEVASEPHPAAPAKQDASNGVSSAEVDAKLESVQGKRSSEPKRDEDSARLDRPWRRNDKSTRSSSAATRSVDEQETKKPRKGRKSKSDNNGDSSSVADQEQKDEPEPPRVELSEAPIPTVNIWQQRKQAQQTTVKPEPARNGTVASATPSDDAASKPAQVNGTGKPHSKTSEKSDRGGSRGNRPSGREAKEGKTETPPSVADATLWPTPETAIQEDKKKTTTADKAERADKEPSEDGSQQSKPRQKKEWVTYNYVPSVSFETQLPVRGSKPRGGAKGSGGSRSGAGAPGGDKAAAAAAAAASSSSTSAAANANATGGASAKPSESRDRPRDSANAANRQASQPPVNKRASMDVSGTKAEQKKAAQNAEKGKDTASGQQQNQGREGRSDRGRGGYRGRGGHHALNPHAQQHQAQHQHQHAGPSASAPPFQPNMSGQPKAQVQGPYSPTQQAQMQPQPRQGHGQMFGQSQRGGGRGGRGGNNFHRMSLPNAAVRPPPVQTQFAPYEYPTAPMSAVPFQQPAFLYQNQLGILRAQTEYYFSFGNLCKDVYLRRHMDSQGFVPLHLIMGFRRMHELKADLGLVRMACEESLELDYVIGEDDVERLRSRMNWTQFTLPVEQRVDSAKHEGPSTLMWRSRHHAGEPNYVHFPMASPPMFGNGQPMAPYAFNDQQAYRSPGMEGMVNGHGNGTQLSAAVPDFSPSANLEGQAGSWAPQQMNGGPPAPSEAVNGEMNGDHTPDAAQP